MRILSLAPALLACVVLAGCAAREPLIDHINVSDAKYQGDLSSCRDQSRSGLIPFVGGSVSDCMKGKGYNVLMGTGL